MQTNLQNKIVLLSGGSRGIGQAIVRHFADEGATVLFTYVGDAATPLALVDALRGEGRSVSAFQVDVRNDTAVLDLCQMIEREHGRLDVLINNAGIVRDRLILAMEKADWDDVIGTNLTGAYNMIRASAAVMVRQRQGTIVNVSSIAATRPGRGHCNYAASKGGIEALTKALASELAPRNIRVNAVAPGMIETEMSREVRERAGDLVRERILLKRFGTPAEIAKAVVFLASDLSSFMTGTVLHVDGGLT